MPKSSGFVNNASAKFTPAQSRLIPLVSVDGFADPVATVFPVALKSIDSLLTANTSPNIADKLGILTP